MEDLDEIRERIEECRTTLARAEGERESLKGQIDAGLEELREILGCKAGGEKKAIEKLRKKVAAGEAEVTRLLDEAEEVAAQ